MTPEQEARLREAAMFGLWSDVYDVPGLGLRIAGTKVGEDVRALLAEVDRLRADKATALQPRYSIGQEVTYLDRHKRKQAGVVQHVEGYWTNWGTAFLVYWVSHPSYRGGRHSVSEDELQAALSTEPKGESNG